MLKPNMKQMLFVSLATLCATSAAHATINGTYVGIQGGIGDTHFTSSALGTTTGSIKNTQIAGRLFLGYQFTQNFALELGYLQFSTTTIQTFGGIPGNSARMAEGAGDLLAKGILPIASSGFDAWGKAGLAFISARPSNNIYKSTIPSNFSGGSEQRIAPEVGLGISYDITPNIPIDLSINHIQVIGSNIPNADFVALGIAYNIGE